VTPSCSGVRASLLKPRSFLALRATGDIRFWNDSAIAALNSELALASKLPSEKILLSAYWDQALEVTQVHLGPPPSP
jgi:hypothetical protein